MRIKVELELDCPSCVDEDDMKESIAQALAQMMWKGMAIAHIETPTNQEAEIDIFAYRIEGDDWNRRQYRRTK
jgi:hypothetical protein